MVDVIAHAEAKAHAVPLSEVHFHEVGAIDSIVDIVSVAVLLDDLDVDRVIVPRLVDGHGTIRCQHGIIPVPVPATLNIVEAHGLPLCRLEATYLGFLDCRALAPTLGGESPRDFFLRVAKVALHDGAIFGSPGWVRINIATHTDLLRRALDRMADALATLA